MAGDPVGLAYLAHARSPLHRMGPNPKLLWLTCIVLVSFTQDVLHLTILTVVSTLIALTLTGVSLRRAWTPIWVLLVIWGPFVLLPPVAYQFQADLMGLAASDTTRIQVLGFEIVYSQIGLDYGIMIFLRAFIVCMACLAVVWTTHPTDTVHALTKSIRLPYKLAWSIFLALIYTPLILHEYEVITHAQAVRGLRNRRGIMGMVDTVRNTFFPLLIRGLRKGSVTSLAMESRGFGAYPTRVFRTDLPRSRWDPVLAWGSVLATLAYYGWTLVGQRLA